MKVIPEMKELRDSLASARILQGKDQELERLRDETALCKAQNRYIAYNAKEDIEGRPECRWRGATPMIPWDAAEGLAWSEDWDKLVGNER